MGTFVNTTDFTNGEILISQSSATEQELEPYIDTVELEILQELFGSTLYGLFMDDLVGGVPQTQRFVDVFNAFYDDSDSVVGWCCGASRSEGIKKMLMRFINFSFTRDQPHQNTPVGTVKNQSENSTNASAAAYGAVIKYNIAVESYQAIARKMILDTVTYPEYNGIPRGKTIFI
jgi:hypothetical protein